MNQFDDRALPWDQRDVPMLMALEQLDRDVFASRCNQANLNGPLFGGQVLGQAAAAAMKTGEGRLLHSLHGYFLRAGVAAHRIVFTVERLRDGRRFATRHVVARQGQTIIFEMSCSFFVPQQGYAHQIPHRAVPPPEALDDLPALARGAGALPAALARFSAHYPIEIRPAFVDPDPAAGKEPRLSFWIRVPSAATIEDPLIHQQMLAYLSDFWLVGAALAPHRVPIADAGFMVASLDHAMWFHKPCRVDDWLLHETESPSAHDGIGFARGLIYDRQGVLVASVAQEALQVPRL
jgi:acyl-CoA thioesterase-2